MSTAEFMECAACAAKPGSPTLCAACLHNRTTINELVEYTEARRKLHVEHWRKNQERLKAMRACIVYARDRRGNYFDFDTWKVMVDAAIGDPASAVPPHALEEALDSNLALLETLARIRKERDDASACERQAITEANKLREDLEKAMGALLISNAQMLGAHRPRIKQDSFKQWCLVGCACGFETTDEDALVKHVAEQQVLANLRKTPEVTKRADGAYTAGPPPDGRRVDEHLNELAAGKRRPAGAKYAGIFKEHDTLARYILLHWLPSRNRGELFTAIQKMEDMNLATDELALILQHQGIPPNWGPASIGPVICRWTRNKVIDCQYCQARACSQHPHIAEIFKMEMHLLAAKPDDMMCQCDEEQRHAALQYEHDDLTSVGNDDTVMRIYCQRAGQVLHHGCGWCATHNRPAFECMCNGPRVTLSAFGHRIIGHRDRVPRCEVADCKVTVSHGEHWHDTLRWWCHLHVPMSGHHEHCPEPCRTLVKGVTFQEVFTDLARSFEHLRKP